MPTASKLLASCAMPQGQAEEAAAAAGAGGEGPEAPASASTAAAAAAAKAASQKWKSIDSGVRQQVYQYFKERLGVSAQCRRPAPVRAAEKTHALL